MTPDELRAEVRRQVQNFVELDPMLYVQSQRVSPLLDQTLVRVIARDLLPFAPEMEVEDLADLYSVHVARTGERNVVPEMSPLEAVEHVLEWLTWSVRDDVHWLKRQDGAGGIPKLLKLGSIPAMVIEADRSIAKLQARHMEQEDGEDAEVVMDLADRYRIWRLKSPRALRNETAMMQHCLGLGGYDSRLRTGTDVFYSLRTRTGKSHATMHVRRDGDRNVVVELRGKQNRMPILRYRRLVLPFLDREGFDWGKASAHSGIVVAEDDRHYPYEVLPEGLAVRDLDVSRYRTVVDVTVLPRFTRNLRLGDVQLAALPENWTVPGNLDLAGSDIGSLPAGLHVKGDLDLTSTRRLRRLPPDLVVDGALILNNSKAREIPATIRFGRLVAHGIPLHLPEGFRASGSMDLSEDYGNLALPDGLEVNGDLVLRGLALGALPAGLVVAGLLDISQTRISSIPPEARFHSLKARESDLLKLDGLRRIPGSVDISRTRVRGLPWGMEIGGDLDISGTRMRWLGPALDVGGRIVLSSGRSEPDIWHRRWLDDIEQAKAPRSVSLQRYDVVLPNGSDRQRDLADVVSGGRLAPRSELEPRLENAA